MKKYNSTQISEWDLSKSKYLSSDNETWKCVDKERN